MLFSPAPRIVATATSSPPKRWVGDSTTEVRTELGAEEGDDVGVAVHNSTLTSESTSWGPKFGDSWSPQLCLNSLKPHANSSSRHQLIVRPYHPHQKWRIFQLRLLWTMAFIRQLKQVRHLKIYFKEGYFRHFILYNKDWGHSGSTIILLLMWLFFENIYIYFFFFLNKNCLFNLVQNMKKYA